MGLTRPRAAQIYDIDYKQSVRVITTTNITLSGGAPTVVDGVTLSLNDRILVTGQSTGSQNGIYTVSIVGTGSNGTWIRSTDTNATGELDSGTIVMVTEGSAYADTSWKLTTNDPIVIGTTALTFEINTGNAFGTISANGTSVISNSASGTVTFSTGNNIVITGNAASDTITFAVKDNPSFTGGVTFSGNITGNLLPSANITYNLGSPTQRWKEIFLAANTIDIGGALISADLATGSLILTGPDGAEFILTGTSPTTSVGQFGMIEISNAMSSHNTTSGALTVVGGAGIGGNVNVGGIIDVVGNSIYLGNLLLKDNGSNIFGLYAADGTTPATISQSSVDTTKISNGTSNVQVVAANANVTISVGGTSNVFVASTAGANVAGTLGVTGNITGGNLSGTLLTGTLTTAAQPNVTSLGTLTSVSVTGNVTGGNLVTSNTVSAGTLTVSGNATVAGNLTVSGNVIAINVTNLNVVDPIIGIGRGANDTPLTTNDGKDRGEQLWYYTTSEQSAFIGYDNSVGKLIAATNVSVSNEVVTVNNYGNLIIGGLEATTISSTGNANVGNLGTAGIIVATGNISGANINLTGNIVDTGALTLITGSSGNVSLAPNGTNVLVVTTSGANIAGTLNVTGNANLGNLGTAGQIVASGNIHGALIKSSANIEIQNRGILYLNDSDNSNYIGLRSPAALTGNYIYIFPSGYGNADQVLSTNGSGGLSWVDQSGGGGGGSATSYPNSTVQPVPGSTGNFDLSYNFVQTVQESAFESSATDPFGVNLGEVYSMMDPVGEVLEGVDLGILI